jgi:hypothetical protein
MQPALSSAALSEWCEASMGEFFDVVLAGKVFVGRYGESPQRLKHAAMEDRTLRLQFNTTEILRIVEPSGVNFEENGRLIERAKEVEFGWHSYGTEEKPENWRTIRLRVDGDLVLTERVTSTRVEAEPPVKVPKYAVQLVRSDA